MYRIAPGWISEAELLGDASYLIESFPKQSDQNRAWERPNNDADRVRQAGAYVTDIAGYRAGYGGAEWRWTFRALSPGMVSYLANFLFGAGARSGEVTTYGFDRFQNAWITRQSVARLEDEAEYELEAGGYALTLTFVTGREAPSGPDLLLTFNTEDPFTAGVTEEITFTVTNSGDDATFDDVVVVAQLPAEYDYVSQSGTDWTAEFSGDGGSTWVSSPPITVTHVRWTRTDPLDSGISAPIIRLGVTPAVAGDHTISVSASTSGVTTQQEDITSTTNAIDLSIIKSHAGTPTSGVNMTWDITVENIGGAETIGEITVTDPLPANFDYVSNTAPVGWVDEYSDDGSTWVGTPPATVTHVRWRSDAETLDPGETAAFTLTVTPTATGTYTNTVTVSTLYDVNSANDSADDETVVT